MLTNDLKQDILTFIDKYDADEVSGLTLADLAVELLSRVLAEPVTDFPVGTRVRSKSTGEYLGTVSGTTTFYTVNNSRGEYEGEYLPTSIEVAPDLDDQTVWSELPLLVIRETLKIGIVLDKDDRKLLRAACYRLLGGQRIKITPEVKARVRDIINQVASLLNVRMNGND